MPLPTREEINVHDTLDERYACRHFLGRNLEEAESLFRGVNPLPYLDDLFWMGPVAFRFYILAAIRFIQSDYSAGHADFIYGFWGNLKHRLDCNRETLATIAKSLADVCRYIVDHWSKFEVNPEMSRRLPPRFISLQQAFEHLSVVEQPDTGTFHST